MPQSTPDRDMEKALELIELLAEELRSTVSSEWGTATQADPGRQLPLYKRAQSFLKKARS